jgi:DNA mismatch repair protein MutL
MVNMPKVKVLPPDVVSKIAAGEVVERPAAVVKELLENALDAGATKVEVHVKDGGKSSIVVKDNGSGIERADLETIFTRHATSKIKGADDLDKLLSLGFRGEALYSIAAVSEVTLRTRAEESSEAWEMFLKGGKREKFMPAAVAGHGTEIKVDEIFFNTPARKKFLKSDAAEFDQILHIFVPYALLYPALHFVLTHNGRTIYDLAPASSASARAAACLNLDSRHIIESEARLAGERITLKLLLGDINIQRPRRDQQFIFVNDRPVQHKNISYHVNEIYKLILPEGINPFFAVFLELPPEDVDVNIHPTKREVRLRQEGRFTGFLRNTVEQALMTKGQAKAAADIFKFETPASVIEQGAPSSQEQGVPANKIVFAPQQKSGAPVFKPDADTAPASRQEESYVAPSFFSDHMLKTDQTLKDRLLLARFIGTFARKYHLFEEGTSLFLVDQHAAQERITFEKFKRQIDSGKVEVQPLLTPLVLKLTPGEMLAWEDLKESLKDLGLETTLFGDGAIAIQAYPALLDAPENAVRALLGEASGDEVARTDKDALARRACRASVMAGDKMAGSEAVHQMKALMACQDPMTCPHGRPVFVELKEGFLDRQFLRT